MIQVRGKVFETNSSSTHSLTMCSEEEFNKWKSGELLFDYYNDCFAQSIALSDEDKKDARLYYDDVKGSYWKSWDQLSDEEIESWYSKYANEFIRKSKYNEFMTYKDWCERQDYLDRFVETYTSPSGDKIIAFGKYGYDG